MFEGIIETLPVQVLVIDVQTHTLLYVNEAARNLWETARPGSKCYSILDRTSPCESCETGQLSFDDYLQSEKDGKDGRHFMRWTKLISWKGHSARLEILLDVTEHALIQQQLEQDLRRKNLITRTARELYESEDLDKGLASVLRMTGRYLRAERSYVFELRDNMLHCTHEWHAISVPSQKDRRQNIGIDAIRQWMARLEQHETVHMTDPQRLQEQKPEVYQLISSLDVQSLVLAPLRVGNRLIGLLAVENYPLGRLNDALALLTTISTFCSSAIWRGRMMAQLQQAGYYDLLTGLLNRNGFIRDLKTPHMMPVGVIYVDLNGLKQVNDEQSHSAGDAMLVDASRTLLQSFPDGRCYRIGGDEFVCILQSIEKKDFQHKLAQLKGIFTFQKQYSASVGGAWHIDPDAIMDVVAAADAEMYREKQLHYGRKTQNPHVPILRNLTAPGSGSDMQGQMENDRVELFWLPRHNPSDGRVIGLEVLARMRGTKGLVLPESFLPILEQTRCAHLLDFTVFDRACAQLRQWMDSGVSVVPVAINFSRHTLLRPELFNAVQQSCARHSIPLHLLELDIPAIVPDRDYDSNVILYDAVRRLYKYGFSIALDGFAFENANLAMLTQVDFNTIKLDSSVLRMVSGKTDSKEMLSLVFALTRKTNILVEAKGVETEEQRAQLEILRCRAAQGYLFSNVMSGEECESFLRNSVLSRCVF